MEKKNTGLIVLVVVLVITVLGTSGFIVYDKVLNNKNNETNNNQENNKDKIKEELWINSDLVQNLYSYVNVTHEENGELLKDYFFKNEKVTLDNISNDTKLWMAYTQLNDIRYKQEGYLPAIKSFDIDKFDIAMKKVFGNDITYEKDDFMPETCDCEYSYNKITKQYVCEELGCGDFYNNIKSKLYKAVKRNDKIILYEKFAYINISEYINSEFSDGDTPNYVGPKAGIYKDVKSEHPIKIWANEQEYEDSLPNHNFDDYLDEMSMVKYTFKKGDDESYHFYSSEIVEDF